jgi:hypothetical protein
MDWPFMLLFLAGLVPIIWATWLLLRLTGPNRGA